MAAALATGLHEAVEEPPVQRRQVPLSVDKDPEQGGDALLSGPGTTEDILFPI